MKKAKPVTEVLAAIYVGELHKLAGTEKWEDTNPRMRAAHMGAMAEVVRALELFGLEIGQAPSGQLVLRTLPQHPPEIIMRRTPPTASMSVGITAESVRKAQQMGFTGIPCDHCGSPNTIRTGKCLKCMDCDTDGECG